MQITDHINLQVSYLGKKEDLHKGLDDKINAALFDKVGLNHDDPDVQFTTSKHYQITLTPLENGQVSLDKKVVGESTLSLADALKVAENKVEQGYSSDAIDAKVTRTADVCYFTEKVVVRSLDKQRLENSYVELIDQLATAYVKRLNKQPASIVYTVLKTTKEYRNDQVIPEEIRSGAILARGESKTSLDEAERRANTRKKSKSIVYGKEVSLRIYGQLLERQIQAPVIENATYATRGTSPDKGSHYTRAGSGSAVEPHRLQNISSFR